MDTLNYDKSYWKQKPCPPIDCRKNDCKCGLKKVFLAAILGDDSEDSPIAPKNGAYCNTIVVYEANNHIYIYSSEGIPTLMSADIAGLDELEKAIAEAQGDIVDLDERLLAEIKNRQDADNVLQGEIDDIKNSPDVVDIVPTYAALQNYDTSKLGDNDIVRVLQDEQHDGQSTYYRWNATTQTWTYIGSVGDYYTKGQVDDLLDAKQDVLTAGANITIDANNEISATNTTYTAGANVQISAQNEISATDTTYSDFTGTDGQTAGSAGLVPAPATTDAGKFLKADGTWDTAGGGGPTVVQTTGTSTTDVMSQNATTSMVFADPSTKYRVQIGDGAGAGGTSSVAIGRMSTANNRSVSIGPFAQEPGTGVSVGTVNIGYSANINNLNNAPYSVAIGAGSKATAQGEFNIGTGGDSELITSGYNNTQYRLISGVHDPVNAHDAATKGYVDANAGGPTVVQTTGTSTTDVMSQDATTSMVFADPSNKTRVRIGNSTTFIDGAASNGIIIGANAKNYGDLSLCAGEGAIVNYPKGVCLGARTTANGNFSVALGTGATTSAQGELNIGTGSTYTTSGYNNSNYRLIRGVHDGQNAHDAVTVGQVNSVIDAINTALSTNIPHIGA